MPSDDPSPRDAETKAFDAGATINVPSSAEPRTPTYPYFPGEAILPGYRLDERLGSGGFGEVWRATAPGGMEVAIKILANLGRAQGGREYRALQVIKNIRHAHIVPIFGVWLKSGAGRVLDDAELLDAEQRLLAPRKAAERPSPAVGSVPLESLELVIAMGLGDQTLSDRLREGSAAGLEGIPPATLLDWMHQAALALDHFNSGGRRHGDNALAVQHCDIKPQNILLVGDVVQVCDFGLARAQGEVRATSNTMASIAYAAPEMVSGSRDPGVTTDQYSLAVTYLELRTGRLPYAEPSPAGILRAKLDGTIDLSSLPEAEAAVVRRALAVAPARRWPSCVAFVQALREAVRSSGAMARAGRETDSVRTTVPVAAAPQETPTTWSRRTWIVPAIAGIVVLGAVIAVATLRREGGVTVPVTRDAAVALETAGRYAEAGDAYAAVLGARNDELASVLWDLQTQAADAGRAADCVPLLRRLESLYARTPAPQVPGLSRWDVVNSLAWYLATVATAGPSAAADAERLAAEGLSLAAPDAALLPQALDTAAAAAARNGRFDEAVTAIERAIATAPDAAARDAFERRRDAYRAGRAWDQP